MQGNLYWDRLYLIRWGKRIKMVETRHDTGLKTVKAASPVSKFRDFGRVVTMANAAGDPCQKPGNEAALGTMPGD